MTLKPKINSKVITFDIETSLMKVTKFNLYPEFINHRSILEDWSVLTISYKFYDQKKIHKLKVSGKNYKNDKQILKKFIKILNQADIIVGHNIKKFDIKRLNMRLSYHGLDTISQDICVIDTYTEFKKVFGASSNRLDYIAKYYNLGSKTETSDSPTSLWFKIISEKDIAKRDKYLTKMSNYNANDVLINELVFVKLFKYLKLKVFKAKEKNFNKICPKCGYTKTKRNGLKIKGGLTYQKYACFGCGSHFSEKLKKQPV